MGSNGTATSAKIITYARNGAMDRQLPNDVSDRWIHDLILRGDANIF